MCGIAGACSASGIDPAVLPGMAHAIRHRGPDGEHFMLHDPQRGIRVLDSIEGADASAANVTAGFAHRRLSIIDLSEASDQPMVDAAGDYALSYNGELYNYLELRSELESLGRPFRTQGDAEVVLNAYAEWGPACLERMVGMWALSILDRPRNVLFLSVDRFGIKPLFHAVAGDTFYFASEIKALLGVPGLNPEPNEDVVRRYLLSGRVDDSEETFFDGIRRVPAATHASVPLDRPSAPLQSESYWSYPSADFRGSRDDAAEEFRALLRDSVRVHLRSDVPVGTCLSGGLDSSSIVCLADELRAEGEVPRYAHSGFGYVPDDAAFSERRHMEQVVAKTGIDMIYVQPPAERFGDALLEIVRQQDEPFGSTSIAAQWFVFEAAKDAGLKVMLDGQGADEVLAGYHGYFQSVGLAHLRAHRPFAYARFNRKYRRQVGEPVVPLKMARHYMRAQELDVDSLEITADLPAFSMLSAGMRARSKYEDVATPEYRSINEILESHASRLGLPALLRYEDRNSMAHSIEARVPFLDHRLVEFAFSLPGDFKLKGLETKDVLRRAMKGTLPEPIRTRKDKIGFRAEPTATWEVAQRNRDALLANRNAHEERWFDRSGLESLLGGDGRDEQSEFLLWRALNTKLWLRTFWDEPSRALAA